MYELEVKVQSEVGNIVTNFAEVKESLQSICTAYEGMEYDDEQITVARKDVATLRKIRKAVEDKRKEVKKAQMMPYEEFEKSCRELTAMLDSVITPIALQITEATERKREAKAKELSDMMYETQDEYREFFNVTDIPAYVEKLMLENPASTSVKKLFEKFIERAEVVESEIAELKKQAEKLPEDYFEVSVMEHYIKFGFVEALKDINEMVEMMERFEKTIKEYKEDEEDVEEEFDEDEGGFENEEGFEIEQILTPEEWLKKIKANEYIDGDKLPELMERFRYEPFDEYVLRQETKNIICICKEFYEVKLIDNWQDPACYSLWLDFIRLKKRTVEKTVLVTEWEEYKEEE